LERKGKEGALALRLARPSPPMRYFPKTFMESGVLWNKKGQRRTRARKMVDSQVDERNVCAKNRRDSVR
jgi:hypothetical protein